MPAPRNRRDRATVRWAGLLWLAAWVVTAPTVVAQVPNLPEDIPIQVDAESLRYDQEREVLTAIGDVVVHYGDVVLRAEKIDVYRRTNVVEAEGQVHLDSPEGVLFADRVRLDLEQEVGAMQGAALRSRRLQYSLWGSSIEKFAGQRYRIVNGRFTTCNCERGRQSWSIAAKDLDVTIDGLGVARGATFNILDVPVLYLPRLVVPVQRERQSGFLLPRFGASNQRGFQTVLPFYWAIDRSREATLGIDVETSARVGLLGEYRYRASRENKGSIAVSYFNEFLRGDRLRGATAVPQDRWGLLAEVRQRWGDRGQIYVDGNWVSDDQFFREINTYSFERGRTIFFRTLPYTVSRVGATYVGRRSWLGADTTYFQNLTDAIESRTVHSVPRARWFGQSAWRRWLLADWDAQWDQFERGQGPAGARVLLRPRLTAVLPLPAWSHGNVSVRFWETAYALHRTVPLAAPGTAQNLPDKAHREQVEVRAEVGTQLQRVYEFPYAGLERVKHTIEPAIQYYFVPAARQDDLPFFDVFDRINRRSVVAYGATSRVLGRFAPTVVDDKRQRNENVRELARFSLLQGYDVNRVIAPLTQRLTESHLSDVDILGRVNPSRFLSFRFAGTLDTGAKEFSSTQVGVFVEDPREPDTAAGRRLATRTSAGVAYRLLANNVLQQIDGNFVVRLTDWAGVSYATRYNVPANRFLENYFGLRLVSRCDCWSLDFAISNRTNPNETEARLQLTLVGLSTTRQATRVAVAP